MGELSQKMESKPKKYERVFPIKLKEDRMGKQSRIVRERKRERQSQNKKEERYRNTQLI